jgi:hypothetical protein
MAKQNLRDASAPLPVTQVVSPEGYIKDIPYGAGINGGIVEATSRGPRISQEARERGWILLGEAYHEESRDGDFKKYQEFRTQAAAGKVNPDSFPDRLLPKLVLDRRSKSASRPSELPAFDAGDEQKTDKKGK